MNDEIIVNSALTANIPFADEDGVVSSGVDHRQARPSVTRRELTKEASSLNLSSRNYVTFRSVQPKIAGNVLQKSAMFGQPQRQLRQPGLKRNKSETVEPGAESCLQRYENVASRYQKPKRRQGSRERQNHGYSSSDESVARIKSKSISSIDTQSVNNILDEYEDLDCRRSSDLSDVGSIDVSNYEAVMMDQQRKQEKLRVTRTKCSVEKQQPVLKVNQQTQVRQRSHERQNESVRQEENSIPVTVDSRTRVPEVLLRKGEVQKRVDEWLNQTQSQNFQREKQLTRSNSSAEQKSQRRFRQDLRSRSIDEGRDKLNGTSSSYDDLSRGDRKPERKVNKVNVGVNTSRGTYKEYLALKSRGKDYGFSASNNVVKSRDMSPSTGSRIPQRGPLSSSFKSKRLESNAEASQENVAGTENRSVSRLTGLVKSRNESDARISGATGVTSVIPCRRASFKRSQNHDQSSTRALVKEEASQRARGAAAKGPTSNFGDQGEPISPNKDGESRRSALTNDSPRAGDKAADVGCKSTEASARSRDCIPRIEESGYKEKRGNKMNQEAVYGARVKSLQGQQESGPRNLQGYESEARKPPVLPRKEHQERCSPIGQSTFKPNGRATLQQLNEQNKCRSSSNSSLEKSPSRTHYSSPNHVEKIYERSLQPQVIHVDDLQSILRPSLQVSAYGEVDRGPPAKEPVRIEEEPSEEKNAKVYEQQRIEMRYEQLETIEEDDQRSEASVRRYPEIGLSQCLRIQQNGRPGPLDKKHQGEPARTFLTFHSNSPQAVKANLQSQPEEPEEKQQTMILEDYEAPYESGNSLMDRNQACHTRENSNLSTATIPVDELESERQAKFKAEDADGPDAQSPEDAGKKSEKNEKREVEVVNEVLVKNLQFKQDLPKDVEHGDTFLRIIEHVGQRSMGFHNVLCDNYENVRGFKENKIYVTKEEMERQRLMDLLRKGDYESVKAVSDEKNHYAYALLHN